MPKYRVTLEENVSYDIVVEADSPEQAGELAEETFVQAEDLSVFLTSVNEREVANVELVREEENAQ